MDKRKPAVSGKDDFAEAKTAAQEVVKLVFEKLASASVAADKPRLFPDGVELIHVKVKVALIDVDVKIAGKGGLNALLLEDGGFQPE